MSDNESENKMPLSLRIYGRIAAGQPLSPQELEEVRAVTETLGELLRRLDAASEQEQNTIIAGMTEDQRQEVLAELEAQHVARTRWAKALRSRIKHLES
jgi:hypothetical protein